MSVFKITDVRVGRKSDGQTGTYIDGLGTGARLTFFDDPIRVALMLAVFNMGRDCYWDTDANVFNTTTAEWNPTTSQLAEGRVTGWEIRVPGTKGIKPELFLHLIDPSDKRQTSGDAAAGWARLQLEEKEITLILGLLSGRYCYYSPSIVRNTDIVESLPV